MRPSLVLLAGLNGAGKSTLHETRIAPNFKGPFVNADLIQRDELRDPSMEASYEAARIAEARRSELIDARQSFAAETVFSHPSKIDLIETARARGYIVVVMHVGVDGPDLSVARVRLRTEEGGHGVPEDKIRARYDRSAPLIREAVLRADRGLDFDNSRLNAPPRQMLVFANGRLTRGAGAAGVDPKGLRRRSGVLRPRPLLMCDRRAVNSSHAQSTYGDPAREPNTPRSLHLETDNSAPDPSASSTRTGAIVDHFVGHDVVQFLGVPSGTALFVNEITGNLQIRA